MINERMIAIVQHDLALRASTAALAAGMGIKVQEFESAEDFLASYDRARCGCLVLEIRLPGMSGLELMSVMNRDGNRTPTIIAGAFIDVRLAVQAMHAGALTVFEKPYRDQDLWDAIRQALSVSGELEQNKAELVHTRSRLGSLTADEQRVLDLVLLGRTNKRIAEELSMGLRTVEARRQSLMVKLNAKSVAELSMKVTKARLLLSSCGPRPDYRTATQSTLPSRPSHSLQSHPIETADAQPGSPAPAVSGVGS